MSKKPRGNINKIREFELEKINLVDEFDILQIVGEGWFGKILLVEHRASQTEMVLKAVPKPYVSLRDFYREFHYGLHLGIHRNIVTTYDVAFETAGFYVFTQEYAPMGDLTSNVTDTGVGEVYSKRVAKQIASALDYMHTKDIVHRDVKLDNVLIYRSDFSRVKLCDFGESYQTGTIVERRNEWLPYSPPEVLDIKPEGTYKADPSHDVWQFGIVIFVCLTGCLPWQKAASDDPRYMRYMAWQGTMVLPIRRTPKLFKLLSSRAQRMFRHFLQPRFERRPKHLADLAKFLDDRWLAKTAEKEMAEYETDELCPSMYSFHSSPDEKHRLLYTLADCGIETNVDRQSKKNRIKDWIEASVITEEDEEENEDTNSASPSSSISREPVAGHISSIRATSDKNKEIKSTLKDATQKHFDPRTGALQQGPSEMGVTLIPTQSKSASPSMSNISMYNNNSSMAGSLLTLGSRPDLLNSNMQIYDSVADLQRIGEPTNFDNNSYGFRQTQSSSNLLTDYAQQQPFFDNASYGYMSASNNLQLPAPLAANSYINVNNNINAYAHPPIAPRKPTAATATTGLKSILQSSKANAAHTFMYASSPALDSASANAFSNNATSTSYSVGFFTDPKLNKPENDVRASNLMNSKSNNKSSQQKTVTFSGLSSAFQTLANITMPGGIMKSQSAPQQQPPKQPQSQPQQQKQQTPAAVAVAAQQRMQFDSPVKDSAYGSAAEIRQSPVRTTKSGMLIETYHPNGMGGTRNISTHMVSNQNTRHSSPQPARTQQPQRFYRGAQTNTSMKDTAYDRVNTSSSNQTRQRR